MASKTVPLSQTQKKTGIHKGKIVLVPKRHKKSELKSSFLNWNGIADDGRSILDGPIQDGKLFDTFIWGTTSFTWGDVVLAAELLEGLISRRRNIREQYSWLQEWKSNNPEKTKQLVHLICRVKGEKVYDESKEIDLKNVNLTLEDVNLVTRRVLGTKSVSIVCEVDDEIFEETKLVEEYE